MKPGTLFYRVFHDSPVGMVITTIAEGRYVDANRAFAQLLGYTREELLSQTFTLMGIKDEEERKMVLDVLRLYRKLGDVPLVLHGKDGSSRPCIGSVQLEEIDGEAYFFIMVQDISEREEVQTALRQSENRFRLFFQSIPLPLLVVDEETFRILDVNTAACRTYGYTRDEFANLSLTDLTPAQDWADFLSAIRKTNAVSVAKSAICRQMLKDGRVVEVDVTSYSFLLDDRPAVLSIIRDVTEQRAIQTALATREEYLRIIADVATDAIWERDLITDKVIWSAGLKTLFGYGGDVDRPHNWWIDHVHPDEREAIDASVVAALESDVHHWTAEYRFLRADGTYANVLDRAFVIRDKNGRPVRFIGAMVDLTDQLHMAEVAASATQEERQRLARDLHDSVTKSLYSVSLMAEAARRRALAGDHQVTNEFIDRLSELSSQALRQVRLLVYELRPGVLEQEGLAGALRNRLEAVEQRAGIRAQLIDECEIAIPPALQSEMFRITQEALNSILKHALTKAITLRLQNTPLVLDLEIRDKGTGPDAMTAEDGDALAAVSRRVRGLGGALDVDAQSGGESIWRIRVPMTAVIPDEAD